MAELLGSVFVLAPGLVLLAAALFVAVLMMLEKVGVFGEMPQFDPDLDDPDDAPKSAMGETSEADEAGSEAG